MTLLSDLPVHTCLRDAEFISTGPFNSTAAGALAFVANAAYLKRAADNANVVAVIAPAALADAALETRLGVLIAEDPRAAFFTLHNTLATEAQSRQPDAAIDPDAQVSPLARIAAGAVIGPRVIVEPMAWIGAGVHLEEDTYIGHGAMIGVRGHFEHWQDGRRVRVAHMGRIKVCSGAQILAGATVQRDVYAAQTVIGQDVVISPGARIAHGVNIGRGTSVTGASVIAGYTDLGEDVWIGPGSTIGNNLTIGDKARVEIGSVVVKSLEAGACVSGNFARPHLQRLKDWARGKA